VGINIISSTLYIFGPQALVFHNDGLCPKSRKGGILLLILLVVALSLVLSVFNITTPIQPASLGLPLTESTDRPSKKFTIEDIRKHLLDKIDEGITNSYYFEMFNKK